MGRAAAASMQGIRNHFEDSYHLNQEQRSCGVYDGHLGDAASAFVASRLPLHVEASGGPTRSGLPRAFLACDQALRGWLPSDSESGTTATYAQVVDEKDGVMRILIASAGDSRSLLFHRGSDSIDSTTDHRPNEPGERSRIEAAGGTVSEEFDPPRIDGKLACSRALGAFAYKKDSTRSPEAQKVSAEPVIYEWEAKAGDLLLLGCDGVFDVFSNERVVKEVCRSDIPDLGDRLEALLRLCLEKEADDNMTIMAVELGEVAVSDTASNSVVISPGSFLKEKDKEVLQHYASFCKRFGWALTKEIVPKAPPQASLTEVMPEPGPERFRDLQPLTGTPAATDFDPTASMDLTASVEIPMARSWTVSALRPLVVVGPSGVGKGTLIAALMERFPERFGFSVSHTTRAPRPGEVNGKHYHFTDVESMKADIAADKFLEHAQVHGNIYGTSSASVGAVHKTGKICILDIDVQGARQVKTITDFHPYHLGVVPPSFEVMESRLRGRGTETEEKIQLRLKNARAELDYIEAEGSVDFILRNDSLATAKKKLTDVICEWYPSLVRQMRVGAKQSSSYYFKVAEDYLEGPAAHPHQQVEIIGGGAAIAVAADVANAMKERGHEVLAVETSYEAKSDGTNGEGSRRGSKPVPELHITLLRAKNVVSCSK